MAVFVLGDELFDQGGKAKCSRLSCLPLLVGQIRREVQNNRKNGTEHQVLVCALVLQFHLLPFVPECLCNFVYHPIIVRALFKLLREVLHICFLQNGYLILVGRWNSEAILEKLVIDVVAELEQGGYLPVEFCNLLFLGEFGLIIGVSVATASEPLPGLLAQQWLIVMHHSLDIACSLC